MGQYESSVDEQRRRLNDLLREADRRAEIRKTIAEHCARLGFDMQTEQARAFIEKVAAMDLEPLQKVERELEAKRRQRQRRRDGLIYLGVVIVAPVCALLAMQLPVPAEWKALVGMAAGAAAMVAVIHLGISRRKYDRSYSGGSGGYEPRDFGE